MGRAFEHFYEGLEDLVGLLSEALPAVLDEHQRWNDVRKLGPLLKIPAERMDEFVRIWEDEFGTKQFRVILRKLDWPVDGTEYAENSGHDAAEYPER